jgi:hypothetical protein
MVAVNRNEVFLLFIAVLTALWKDNSCCIPLEDGL